MTKWCVWRGPRAPRSSSSCQSETSSPSDGPWTATSCSSSAASRGAMRSWASSVETRGPWSCDCSTVPRTGPASQASPGRSGNRCEAASTGPWEASRKFCCPSTARRRTPWDRRCSLCARWATRCRTRTTTMTRLADGITSRSSARARWALCTGRRTCPAACRRRSPLRSRRSRNRRRRAPSSDMPTSCTARRNGPCRGCTTRRASGIARRRRLGSRDTSRITRAIGRRSWASRQSGLCSKPRTSAGSASGPRCRALAAHMWSWSSCREGPFTNAWAGAPRRA
mmetsp:Transcript_95583/g.275406  ORF Transcript_95583/g.275406 Transcript_95583/m.275406 type:complete len:283 (-) Transcript_95583:981-1829(-)